MSQAPADMVTEALLQQRLLLSTDEHLLWCLLVERLGESQLSSSLSRK